VKRRLIILPTGIVAALGLGTLAISQTLYQEMPYHLTFRQNNPIMRMNGRLQLQTTGGTLVSTTPYIYTASLAPAVVIAGGNSAQAFTVSGVATTDRVFVSGPAPVANCTPLHARVTATDSVTIYWTNYSGTACTPQTGVYSFVSVGGN
jgi:hypothetical protein